MMIFLIKLSWTFFSWISVKIRIIAFCYHYVWLTIKSVLNPFWSDQRLFGQLMPPFVFEVSIIGVFTNDTKSAFFELGVAGPDRFDETRGRIFGIWTTVQKVGIISFS